MAGRRSIVEFEKALAKQIEGERAEAERMAAAYRDQMLKIDTLQGVLDDMAKDDDEGAAAS